MKFNRSLELLSNMNYDVQSILKNFVAFKWKGQSFNAQLHMNNNCNKNSLLYENLNIVQCNDELYVGFLEKEDDNHRLLMIYLSDNLISYDVRGQLTIDLLYRGNVSYSKVACCPAEIYRTYDNKSVEFCYFDTDDEELWDKRYITLGLFHEKFSGEYLMELLQTILSFLNNIEILFEETLFLPYIIHPYRLILFKDNMARLVSCNLLQYVLCPYMAERMLCDLLFSHPNVIKHNKKNINPNHTTFLKCCTKNVILQFFHSFFVTVIFIILGENNQNLGINRGYCNAYHKGYEVMFDYFKHCKNNKRKKPSDKIEQEKEVYELLAMTTKCQNSFGYCETNKLHDNQRKLIHEYGCEHLLNVTPLCLNVFLDREHDQDSILHLKNLIKKEFFKLRQFVCDIITTI